MIDQKAMIECVNCEISSRNCNSRVSCLAAQTTWRVAESLAPAELGLLLTAVLVYTAAAHDMDSFQNL